MTFFDGPLHVLGKARRAGHSLSSLRIGFRGWRGIIVRWAPNNLKLDGRFRGAMLLYGRANTVSIGRNSLFQGRIIVHGNSNIIEIGQNCPFTAQITIKGDGQTVRIGDHTSCRSLVLQCQGGCDVSIGRHSMLSRNITIRTSDAHALVDRETGERINQDRGVAIGDHVWIGMDTLFSKGAQIADDCVVGARSFVNKSFQESGVVIAGAPARIVRRGISWQRGKKERFEASELENWRH